jgi:hypothetical protein
MIVCHFTASIIFLFGEAIKFLGVAIPAGIEGEDVLIEHALKQANHMIAILHYQPILRLMAHESARTQLIVKELRRLDIFDSQAHREISQFHDFLLGLT